MKKFKLKFTLLVLGIVASISSVLFAPTGAVYGATWDDMKHSQSKEILISTEEILNSDTFEYDLFGTGDDTKSFYDLTLENKSKGTTGKNLISGTILNVFVNAAVLTNQNSIINLKSSFEVTEEMKNLINDGVITLSLQATMQPASSNPDTHTMYLCDETGNKVQSESFSSDSGLQTITLSSLGSTKLYALFTAKCGKIEGVCKNEIKVTSPKLIFTKKDTAAPTITFMDNTGLAYNENGDLKLNSNEIATGRRLTFSVADDKAGVKFVKYNGAIITADSDGNYTINADYSKDNTIEFADLVGNTDSYTIAKDTTEDIGNLTIIEPKFSRTTLSFNVSYVNNEINIHRSMDNLCYALTTTQNVNDSDFKLLTKSGTPTFELDMNNENLGDLYRGNYYLHVRVVDMAGNKSAIKTQAMYYTNPTECELSFLTSIGGNIKSIKIGGENLDLSPIESSDGYSYGTFKAWTDDTIEIKVEELSGYEFYRCIDSENTLYKEDSGTIIIQNPNSTTIKIDFRYLLNVSLEDSQSEYNPNENVYDIIKNNLVVSGIDSAKDIEINASKNDIIGYSITDVAGNAVTLKNAQTYIISWFVKDDYKDLYVLSGDINIKYVISPKVIDVIFDNTILTYTGKELQATMSYTNPYDEDLELIVVYLANNQKLEAMINAGEYDIELSFNNPNYSCISSNKPEKVIVNKQIVNAVVETSELYFNNCTQSLEYYIVDAYGNIVDSIVTYTIKVGENWESRTDICEAGLYGYTITLTPDSSLNYELAECVGQVVVNKLTVYFVLDKNTYDYTASEIELKFSTYSDAEYTNVIDGIDGLEIIVNDGTTKLIEAGIYSVKFATTNASYEIMGETSFEIEIVKTIITIDVIEKYTYIGSPRNAISYKFYGEENEELSVVTGITCAIFSDENYSNEIESFENVGTYYYKFTIDPRFEVKNAVDGQLKGVFYVEKAKLEFGFDADILEYTPNTNMLSSLDYYNLGYTLKLIDNTENLNQVDYKSIANVIITYTKADSVLAWGDVGEYGYVVSTNNPNIELLETSGVLTIAPKIVTAQLDNNAFDYNGEIHEITYTLDCALDTRVQLVDDSIIKTAGTYYYNIICDNTNYEIRVLDAQLVDGKYIIMVRPKTITWTLNYDGTPYIYSGKSIDLNYALNTSDIIGDDQVNATIVAIDGGEVNLVDAGIYNLKLVLDNDNYIIENGEFEIKINPKKANINVSDLSQEYAGCVLGINSAISDNEITIRHHVLYVKADGVNESNFDSALKVEPINVGKYIYKVIIDNRNYVVSNLYGEFEITPKLLSVEFSNNSKTYGSIDPDITPRFMGICNDDKVNVTFKRESGENVGSYDIKVLGIDNNNYYIDENTTSKFTIYAKNIIVIADKSTAVYGEDYTLTYIILMDNKVVDTLIGDDELFGELSINSSSNKCDVGVYEITKGTLYNSNYNITFVSDYLTIKPCDLIIAPNSVSVTYGDLERELTFDTLDTLQNKLHVDTNELSGSLSREMGENVGNYTITLGTLSSKNYNLILSNATYSITPKDVTVKANKTIKTYGDIDNLTYVASGLINGDVLKGTLSREMGEDVGEYAITSGTITNENNPNYNIIFVSDTLKITKAELYISVDDKTQVYGENSAELTCSVEGLKFDDKLDIELFRQAGDNAGIYLISGIVNNFSGNYVIAEFLGGTYTIQKATVTPQITDATYIYSGKPYSLKCTNFDNVKFICTHNGLPVDKMINAGEYVVKAVFEGDENYNATESREATLVIEKQTAIFTISKNEFIYDGKIKYPEYYFDKNIGLKYTSIVFNFEDGIEPIEANIDGYNYTLSVYDDNYKGGVSGKVYIRMPFSQIYENSSIIECVDGTYDDGIKDIKLVQDSDTKKFNNERVLTVCSIENAKTQADGYVYTVKVKATEGINSVKVYKVGLNGFKEIAINVEDGYYVFQVDDLNDKYIITTHIKTLSTLAWVIILILVALIFTITLIVVIKKKHKKAKAIVTSDKDNNNSNKDIETYNIN